MSQYKFSTIRPDAEILERLKMFVFKGCETGLADAAARRMIALWNRFVNVPTESLEAPTALSAGSMDATAFINWAKALEEVYPRRIVDGPAIDRIRNLLCEAEQVYASMPVSKRKPAEARS